MADFNSSIGVKQPLTPNFLLLFFLLTFTTTISAQFGVSGYYRIAQDDSNFPSEIEGYAFGNGYEVALDYWFRLKNKRVEFLPTLSYGNYNGTTAALGPTDGLIPNVGFKVNEFGFQFKTNIYLFDFGTDCDCPTFGKQGPALHKGFYLQLAPGYSFFSATASGEGEFGSVDYSNNQGLPSLGVGAGIDFGVNNLITITPHLGYRHYFGDNDWVDRNNSNPFLFEDSIDQEKSLSNLHFGIRLGVRLDERRY